MGGNGVRYPSAADFAAQLAARGLDGAQFECAAVISKLHVAKGQRASTVMYPLAEAAFLEALHSGIRYLVLDSEKWLVPFYQDLGYRIHGKLEASAGRFRSRLASCEETVVLILDLHDEDNLRKVRSPFLKFLEDRKW